ncbi:MAG: discoidin domain-containing protein [Phaeodactylibacter sp.]|nr:discoidin domain-containing protein [Phaeodactylibacter sp.]
MMDFAGGATINDGVTDATAAIQAALDSLDADEAMSNTLTWSNTLYFPAGTYLVSGPLTVMGIDSTGAATGRTISILGAGREYTTIKLANNCSAFQDSTNPIPLFSNVGPGSVVPGFTGIAFMNNIMDLTVDVGSGNPGAIGIRYIANNQGTMRNVDIVAQGAAFAGIDMERATIPGPALIKNVNITGPFASGVRVGSANYSMVLENITTSNITGTAVHNGSNSVTIRNLTTSNTGGPSIVNAQADGMITLVDAQLGGNTGNAIENDGYLFARNVQASGYTGTIRSHDTPVATGNIAEFVQDSILTLWQGTPHASLNLGPVPETPDAPLDSVAHWVDVTDAQFSPDSSTTFLPGTTTAPNYEDDIGPYIINAIAYMNQPGNEHKNTLYFPPGHYRLETNDIVISGNVKRIIGNFAGIATKRSIEEVSTPVFRIQNTDYPELYIERMFFIPNGASMVPSQWDRRKKMPIFENSSSNTVVLRNIYIGHGKAYVNAGASGTLFLEDFAALSQHFYTNDDFENEVHPEAQPQFEFGNQTVWARQLDSEQRNVHVETNGGQLWILGYKTEQTGPVLYARNNAKLEVLGGLILPSEPIANLEPAIIVENSEASVCIVEHVGQSNFNREEGGYYKRVISETRGNETRHINRGETPLRFESEGYNVFVLPLFVSNGLDTAITCPPPSVPTVKNITQTGATINWSPAGDSTYLLQYRKTSDSSWQQQAVAVDSLELSGLRFQTPYEVRVATLCGTDTSFFSTPVEFETKRGDNLALGKPATGDSQFADPEPPLEPWDPANAVDGDIGANSRWMSAQDYTPGSWLEIDLLDTFTVDQAAVFTGFGGSKAPANFVLQYKEGNDWVDIGGASVKNNPATKTDFEFHFHRPVTGRYFRVYSTDDFLRLREVELFEALAVYPTVELLDITPSEYLYQGDAVTLLATAAAQETGATLDSVAFLYGEQLIGYGTEGADGNFSITWPAVAGLHQISAKAIDSYGTASRSPQTSVSVYHISGNVVENKHAYADTEFLGAGETETRFPALLAIDGDTIEYSRWMSATSGSPHWLVADLFGEAAITRAELYLGFFDGSQYTNAPSSFVLQYWDGATWVDISETEVTGNPDTITDFTFTFDTITTTQLRFYSTNSFVRMRELKAFGAMLSSRKNVALLKPAEADSEFSGDWPAGQAVDGNPTDNSRWMSATWGPPHWLEIDLLNTHIIDRAELYLGFGGLKAPAGFVLQYWDGVAWADIPGTTVSGNPESNTFFNQLFSSAVTASKVRFQSADDFVRAREVMIFAANEDYPEVALASPANEGTFSEGETITLLAEAVATAAGAQVDSVAFFANSTRIGSDQTPGDGFSLDWEANSGQILLTAVAYDNLGHSIISQSTSITVYPLSGNIALLKPATADSQFDSRFPPELAVDGGLNDDSRWMSVTTGSVHWLEVDLLGEYRTDSTKLFFGFGGDKAPSNFVLQYWEDSTSTWVNYPETAVSGNPATTTDFSFQFGNPVTTSKVRIHTTDSFIRMRELQLFGEKVIPDTLPPTVPANVAVSNLGENSFTLSWNASTDDVGVTGYDVLLDGAVVDSTSGLSYAYTGLSAGTAYIPGVRARDAAGNVSAAATIQASTNCQQPNGHAAASGITATGATVSWDSLAPGPYKLRYRKYYAPTPWIHPWHYVDSIYAASQAISGLDPETEYQWSVADLCGTQEVYSWNKTFTTTADITPPTSPTNLAVSAISQSSLTLNWAASTDDVGVTGYEVLLDGVLVTTTSTLSYAYAGLSAGTTYTLGVRARDAAGNLSAAATIQASTNCQQPNGHAAASGITATGATVSWDSLAPGPYKLRYRKYYAPTPWIHPWHYVDSIYAASQAISGLDPETEYQWSVAYLCGTQEVYSWNKTFTTLAPPQARPGGIPENVQAAAGPEQSFAITVFPNPARGQFNLKIESNHADERAWLQVLDAGGRMVLSQPVAIQEGEQIMEILLDRNLFQPGLYFVQAAGKWGREVKKLIIE